MRGRSFAALALSVSLTGCGGIPRAELAREEVSIGVLANFTHPDAQTTAMLNGVRMAINEYNHEPTSRYLVNLRRFDTKGSPEGAGTAATRASNLEKSIGVVGPIKTDEIRAAGAVMAAKSVPMIVGNSEEGLLDPSWTNVRRLVASDVQVGRAAGNLVVSRSPLGVASFHDGSESAVNFLSGVHAALAEAKHPLIRTEQVAKIDEGFVKKLISQKPGSVVFAGGRSAAIDFFKTVRRYGSSATIFVGTDLMDRSPEGFERVVVVVPYVPPPDGSVSQPARRFRSAFGADLPSMAVEYYEAGLMLTEAVDEAGTSSGAVMAFLRAQTEFLGDSKRYRYDEHGSLRDAPTWSAHSDGRTWLSDGVIGNAPPKR
ncbi:MAG TPA: ABC transporter substrate-binding protein [Actinomycetota bacterium]|nr:ABC transporter substrate-binding protein [Actinomycetota bacterium]